MYSLEPPTICLEYPKDIFEVAYNFQCSRDTIAKFDYKLPFATEWYNSPAKKAVDELTQDENYYLSLSRYVFSNGETTGWIARPSKINIHARCEDYDEVELTGKQVLQLIYDIYQLGDTVDDGVVDLF